MEDHLMSPAESRKRSLILAAARGWIGTPYHTGGRVKGVGVDCLTLLAEVYLEAGAIAGVDIPYYPPDWHLHQERERYLEGLQEYAREVESPQPGDIALWRFGRCFSHGAIVMAWPVVIHAEIRQGCALENVEMAAWLKGKGDRARPVRFFSCFSGG